MHVEIPRLRESLLGRQFELIAATITAAGKFIFSDWLGHQFYFTIAAIVFWVAYVTLRYTWNHSVLRRWGFTREGFKHGAELALGAFVVGLGCSLFYGRLTGQTIVNNNLILLLVLYPLWGTIQQFLLVGLFAENIVAMSKEKLPEFVAVMLAAVMFAAVHVPDRELVVATFFLGIASTLIFFRTRNLWAVGILHGWFASVFYFFGMGVDPLAPLLAAAFGS